MHIFSKDIFSLGFLLLFLIVSIDSSWEWLRLPLSYLISTQLGREVTFLGGLDLRFHDYWYFQVTANEVRVANMPWAKKSFFVQAKEIKISLDIRSALRGHWVFSEISLVQPILHLEKSDKGIKNWQIGGNKSSPLSISIGKLLIQEGLVSFWDPNLQADLISHVDSPSGGDTMVLQGEGHLRGQHTSWTLHTGSPIAFLENNAQFVEGALIWGKSYVRWVGTLQKPLTLEGLDWNVEWIGPNPADLTPLLGVSIPDLPNYYLKGHLTRSDTFLGLDHIRATLGKSDFSGSLLLEQSKKISGQLDFNQLDLSDFESKKDEKPEPKHPIHPIAPGLEIDLYLHAQEITITPVLNAVKTHLHLKNSKFYWSPFDFEVGGGKAHLDLTFDTQRMPPNFEMEGHFQGVDLKKVLALPEAIGPTNRLSGKVHLQGQGQEIQDFLSSAEGEAFFLITHGQLDSLLLALTRLDLAETLHSFLFQDQQVSLRCAAARVEAKEGILSIKPMIMDATTTKVTGEGTIDLGRKQLDLTLESRPKNLGLFTAHTPIRITGTFSSLEVRPKAGVLGGRVAAAATLGVLMGPVGAIMPFIEPGIGQDNDCTDLISEQSSQN